MTTKLIAHFTDAHLGQRLVMGGEIAGDKMRYENEPEEHQDRLRLILDDISRKGVSDVVFGGDIGAQEAVGEFFELLNAYNFTPAIVLGNHDDYRNVSPYYNVGASAVEGQMCSSRDDGHLKHIFLDSSENMIGDRQLAWLARELEGANKVALFLHHPILEIDTPLERSGVALRDRDRVKALLRSLDCEATIFCGHYHMLDEAREANIRQFVTPAVSYQIVRQSDRIQVDIGAFGYRLLEIDGAEIRTEVVLLTKT